MSMFVLAVTKTQRPGIGKVVHGDLPMSIFFIPTHPYYMLANLIYFNHQTNIFKISKEKSTIKWYHFAENIIEM